MGACQYLLLAIPLELVGLLLPVLALAELIVVVRQIDHALMLLRCHGLGWQSRRVQIDRQVGLSTNVACQRYLHLVLSC